LWRICTKKYTNVNFFTFFSKKLLHISKKSSNFAAENKKEFDLFNQLLILTLKNSTL